MREVSIQVLRRTVSSKAIMVGFSLLAAGSAVAGMGGAISPSLPATVTVGQTYLATLTMTNAASEGNASENVVLSDIFFTPSCATSIDPGTCVDPDPLVFSLGNVVVPAPGTACAGINFSLGTPNAVTGEVQLLPNAPVILGPANSANPLLKVCKVTLSLTVLKLPGKDSTPPNPPITTDQLGRASLVGQTSRLTGSATGSNTVEVTAPTAARPLFVIGDVEPHGMNDVVNFWGAQWWKNNKMSGPVANGVAGFKGFAVLVNGSCGSTWQSLPGNSSNPPANIGDIVTIIVTSTVTKSGNQYAGNIVRIAHVDQDGNYADNPGHEGQGPVVDEVCPAD